MLIFAWLFSLVGIIFSVLDVLSLLPWFVISIVLTAHSMSRFNYVHIAILSLIQLSWFGYSADILIISMIGMGFAYNNQLHSYPSTFVSSTFVSLLISIDFIVGLNIGVFTTETVFNVLTILIIRFAVAYFTTRYFIKKAQLQYA